MGKKMKNEAVGNKMKKNEKGERKKKKRKRGRASDFLLIYGTLLLIIVYYMTFHDPLRGKLGVGEKYKN